MEFHPDPARKLSASLYDIYHLCVRVGSAWSHPDPTRKLSADLYDIYLYCGYSEKLLMMDRGILRNK